MISVVMATYNGEKYIRKQIESILNQELSVDEFIISDDASTDSTYEILKEYSQNYPEKICLFQNKVRKGYVKNFWDAVQMAKGDIIIFADQDDIWYKNKTKLIVRLFDKYDNVLAVNMAYKLIDENDNVIENYKNIKFKNNGMLKWIGFHDFIKSPRYPGMSMAIRKDLIFANKEADLKYLHSHDWFFNQAAAYQNGMLFIDTIVGCYRQHSNNTDGVSSVLSGKEAYTRRIKIINEQIAATNVLMHIYADNLAEQNYFEHLLKRQKLRLTYVKNKKLFFVFVNYIVHFKYISFRDFLGDSYAVLRGK